MYSTSKLPKGNFHDLGLYTLRKVAAISNDISYKEALLMEVL